MNLSLFVQKASDVFTQNRLLKFCMVAMALAVIFNSFMVFRAVKYQRVILIPPKMTGTVEFVRGQPTDNYLKDMCRRMVNLALTYTPATARSNFSDLLAMYDPKFYPRAEKIWYSLADRVEDSKITSVFYIQRIKVQKKSSLEITGELRQYTAAGDLFKNQTSIYIIDYRIGDGTMYLQSINEKVSGRGKK